MNTIDVLALASLALAAVPAVLFFLNLTVYRRLPPSARSPGIREGVSVLIPARNEEANIRLAVQSAQEWKGRAQFTSAQNGTPALTHINLVVLAGLIGITPLLIGAQEVPRDSNPGSSTPARPTLRLEDQFGHEHALTFPTTNRVLVTYADRKGSEQIAPWVASLRKQASGGVTIVGVANLEGVPGAFRNRVRSRFKEKFSYPVLLDWEGTLRQAFPFRHDVANIYLFDSAGKMLCHESGPADPEKMTRLMQAIQPATSESRAPSESAHHVRTTANH
jgi:hypothetical protein